MNLWSECHRTNWSMCGQGKVWTLKQCSWGILGHCEWTLSLVLNESWNSWCLMPANDRRLVPDGHCENNIIADNWWALVTNRKQIGKVGKSFNFSDLTPAYCQFNSKSQFKVKPKPPPLPTPSVMNVYEQFCHWLDYSKPDTLRLHYDSMWKRL
jgi:hypothetical protein